MHRRYSRLVAAIAAVLAAVLAPLLTEGDGRLGALRPSAAVAQGPWVNVPKANCGPDDRTESGLQGQTTLAEQFGGAAELGFNCNLELVGQYEGTGASYQMASFRDCAYYGTADDGTVVVDVSDSHNPRASVILDTPAMIDPHESLKVHEKRKLLAGVRGGGPGFAIYDISDCARPVLKSSMDLANSEGHAGDFSPDGRTYYASQSFRGLRGIMPIIDVSDPSNPRHLLNWQFPGDGRPHDPSFSDDGTRMYSPQPGQFGRPVTDSSVGPNGLVISDVSDIQFRRPNPQIRVISTLFWEDGGQAQYAQPVKIKGRPYLIFTDERGSGGVGFTPGACARGLPPFAFTRIIDVSDDRNPWIVSNLMLEVHDPANCSQIINDGGTSTRFLYDAHYCTVDNPKDAKLVGCSYFASGLRVFDISNPFKPREIAYYKPPARRTEVRPGSRFAEGLADRTYDWTSSNVRFVHNKRGEYQIWFTSHDNGFQVVKFTNGLNPVGKDTGKKDKDEKEPKGKAKGKN